MKHDFNAASAEFKVVRADDEHAIALMRRAYHEIYEPAFPIEEERDSLDKIESRLRNPVNGVKRVILLAGKHFDKPDPEKADLYAIGIAYYYSSDGAGLLAYNAVGSDYQGAGFGKAMVEGRIKGLKALAEESGQTLKSVIIEVNDPAKVKPEEDSMDPAKRVALFERWGARRVPVDYVQPPLAQGLDKGRTSLLMVYPLDGKYPGPEEVGAFVTGIWKANNNGTVDYTEDPDYQATMRDLKKWGGFKELEGKPAPPAPPARRPGTQNNA